MTTATTTDPCPPIRFVLPHRDPTVAAPLDGVRVADRLRELEKRAQAMLRTV